jgi:hypothetical protein
VALGGAGVGVGESKPGSFVTLRGLNWQETIFDDGIDSAWLKNFAPQRLCRPRIAFAKTRPKFGTANPEGETNRSDRQAKRGLSNCCRSIT